MFAVALNRCAFITAIVLNAGTLIGFVGGCAEKAPPARPAAFWPPYPDEPRIQYLRSIQKSADIQPPKTALQQMATGDDTQGALDVKLPYGVKMWQGRIYVCDITNSWVTIFDLHKKQTFVIGRGDSDKMIRPCDIAIAADGTKYVADNGRDQVLVYDSNDVFVTAYTKKDLKPVAVAVYQDELYICDFVGQRVVVMDRTNGKFLRTIGSPGGKFGQFVRPVGIAVDSEGNIYVTDVMKCQVQKFDAKGKLLLAFGERGDNMGALARPKQIAVDNDGNIYVVDAAFENVQVFNQKGQLLTFFGSPGPHMGGMDLPAGISIHEGDLDLFSEWVHPAFQPQRLILVTNQSGLSKIAVYALGKLKPGKTVADIRNTKGTVSLGLADKNDGNKLAGVPTTAPSTINPLTGQSATTQPAVFGPTFGPVTPGPTGAK